MVTPSDESVAMLATVAVTKIHQGKQPRRPHFIQEWAELRGYAKPADLARALDADKSNVSRWYSGTTPGIEWQERLAAAFHCDRDSLFRHPDDDWMARFLKGRQREEIERMKALLQAAFPKAS